MRSGDGVGGSRPARVSLLPLTLTPGPGLRGTAVPVPAAEPPAGHTPQRNRSLHRPSPQRAVLVLVLAAYALFAAGTTAFTRSANIATAVPIVAVLVLVVVRWPLRARPLTLGPDAGHPWRAWVCVFGAVVAWEVAEYAARGSRADHPTLSSMARRRESLLRPQGDRVLPLAVSRRRHRAAGKPAPEASQERGAVTSALSYAVWALLGLALLGVWVRASVGGSTLARPGVVLERLATGPFLRIALVLAWGWMGWHLFAR